MWRRQKPRLAPRRPESWTVAPNSCRTCSRKASRPALAVPVCRVQDAAGEMTAEEVRRSVLHGLFARLQGVIGEAGDGLAPRRRDHAGSPRAKLSPDTPGSLAVA